MKTNKVLFFLRLHFPNIYKERYGRIYWLRRLERVIKKYNVEPPIVGAVFALELMSDAISYENVCRIIIAMEKIANNLEKFADNCICDNGILIDGEISCLIKKR